MRQGAEERCASCEHSYKRVMQLLYHGCRRNHGPTANAAACPITLGRIGSSTMDSANVSVSFRGHAG